MRIIAVLVTIAFIFSISMAAVQEQNNGNDAGNSPSIIKNETVSMRIEDRSDPFGAARTSVNFILKKDDIVRAKLFNIQGLTVGVMTDTLLKEGNHRIVIDAWDLSWGVYWCIISTPDTNISRKLLFLK